LSYLKYPWTLGNRLLIVFSMHDKYTGYKSSIRFFCI
jgi:hypothetical protein